MYAVTYLYDFVYQGFSTLDSGRCRCTVGESSEFVLVEAPRVLRYIIAYQTVEVMKNV